MPSKYAKTSNMRYMTSHVRLSERGSLISDCHVIMMFTDTPAQGVFLLIYCPLGDVLHDMHVQPIRIERVSFTFTSFMFDIH